jgi:serine/threonine-protein kinase RsbW
LAAREHSSETIRGAGQGEAVELVVPNAIEAIQQSLPELERFIAVHGVGPVAANRVQVIFEEIVSNAIRHGFTPGSDQSIQVRLRADGDLLELTFEDDGAPFNPFDQVAPAPAGSLESARLGGLGIPLVRKMAASARYERPAPTGVAFEPSNRVIVTVAR